jgi:hypothetical protein
MIYGKTFFILFVKNIFFRLLSNRELIQQENESNSIDWTNISEILVNKKKFSFHFDELGLLDEQSIYGKMLSTCLARIVFTGY